MKTPNFMLYIFLGVCGECNFLESHKSRSLCPPCTLDLSTLKLPLPSQYLSMGKGLWLCRPLVQLHPTVRTVLCVLLHTIVSLFGTRSISFLCCFHATGYEIKWNRSPSYRILFSPPSSQEEKQPCVNECLHQCFRLSQAPLCFTVLKVSQLLLSHGARSQN